MTQRHAFISDLNAICVQRDNLSAQSLSFFRKTKKNINFGVNQKEIKNFRK